MIPACLKPLRRKIGVVTLIVACVFTVGWVRSWRIIDALLLNTVIDSTSQVTKVTIWYLQSVPNYLTLHRVSDGNTDASADEWTAQRANQRTWRSTEVKTTLVHQKDVAHWPWVFGGFAVGEFHRPMESSATSRWVLVIPYWSIVLPLILLSTWLLLGKRRSELTRQTAEPLRVPARRHDVELDSSLINSFSVRVGSPTYQRMMTYGYSDTLLTLAIETVPETTFEHLRTDDICYGPEADDTESLYRVSANRPNVLALLACNLTWSKSAYLLASMHSISAAEVEEVQKRMTVRGHNFTWPKPIPPTTSDESQPNG